MKKNILFIDTSSNQEVTVSLAQDGKEDRVTKALSQRKAQVVLPMVDELLKKHGLEPKDLTEIQVNPGPGSFTGVRVGVSIANTLGTILGVPVNGKKVGEIVEAVYSESKFD